MSIEDNKFVKNPQLTVGHIYSGGRTNEICSWVWEGIKGSKESEMIPWGLINSVAMLGKPEGKKRSED